jgi:hypothetical protein
MTNLHLSLLQMKMVAPFDVAVVEGYSLLTVLGFAYQPSIVHKLDQEAL